MKIFSHFLAALALLMCGALAMPAQAFHRGNPAAVVPPTLSWPCVGTTSFASYSNGFANCGTQFPVFLFGENPLDTAVQGYSDLPHAAAAMGVQIFFGGYSGSGNSYPEAIAADNGEMTALKNAGELFMPYGGGTNANSASDTTVNIDCTTALNNLCTHNNIIATAATYSYTGVIGYDAGDEPGCGTGLYSPPTRGAPLQLSVPTAMTTLGGYDTTRMPAIGQGDWVASYTHNGNAGACFYSGGGDEAAFTAPAILFFDFYPLVSGFADGLIFSGSNVTPSDGSTHPYDANWAAGMAVKQALALEVLESVRKPLIATISGGGDALASDSGNWIHVTTNGTTTISINTGLSAHSFFSNNMDVAPPGGSALGIVNSSAGVCADIPAGTVFVSITDSTHAVMNHAATGSTADCLIGLTGGTAAHTQPYTGCNTSNNICPSTGHAYRDLAVDIGAQFWGDIINGANGIQFFCHDSQEAAFCAGGNAGGAAALAAQQNDKALLAVANTYVDTINHTYLGLCSPQNTDGTITLVGGKPQCTQGILTVASGNANCPIQARIGQRPGNGHYILIIQTDRQSWGGVSCPTTGAVATVTASGLGAHSGVIGWDSNKLYDAANDSTGNSVSMNSSGVITLTLGANGDGYETLIVDLT